MEDEIFENSYYGEAWYENDGITEGVEDEDFNY